MGSRDIDDPDLPLATLFRNWPGTARVFFFAHGRPASAVQSRPFHTVADACAEYRLDDARLRAALRTVAAGAATPPPR